MAVKKYLDASTAYIRQRDSEVLEQISKNEGMDQAVRVIRHEHGWWIHQYGPDTDFHARGVSDLSPAFWMLMDEAERQGCRWVNLDADGEDDLDLPTYEW